MTHTPTDLRMTTEGSIELAPNGDFATVSHNEYVKQRIVSSVFDGKEPHEGGALTPNTIEELKADIRAELESNEYVDGPISVSVIERTDDTVQFHVETQTTQLLL